MDDNSISFQVTISIDREQFSSLWNRIADLIPSRSESPKPEPEPLRPIEKDLPPEQKHLLLDIQQVADLLDLSDRTIWGHAKSGRMLKPLRFGRAVRWNAIELRKWIEADCPTHDQWQKIKREQA